MYLRPSVAGLVAAAALIAPAAVAQQTDHAFVYVADKPLKSVSLAGTFNNWDKNTAPLKPDADGKTWRVLLPLGYGKHQYKFVLDGETWVTDPAAKAESDGNGNTNSVLLLFPADYARPARPDDGVIAQSALLHETGVPYRNYDRGILTLSLRTRTNDVRAVSVILKGKPHPMTNAGGDELYTRWVAHIPWNRKTDIAYTFLLQDRNLFAPYQSKNADGSTTPFTLKAKEFKPFQVPGWVEKSVLYQIFPDRFANGDKTNDPKDVSAWDAKPQYFNRFGGDVAGVRAHVPYLSSLGISAVYFNPVFKSPSNHRYDTEDYKTLDPQFGTNQEFASLTRELQKRGIRTIMDFVFNHTATTFAPFMDIRQKGAASEYKDWYFIQGYPIRVQDKPNYTAWYGYASMPKLNVVNPATRDYLLGVADFWKKEVPLSGLRLDVANEVDPSLWRALRQDIKAHDAETWIVGEQWGDGSPWLGGDQWDSVMDYPFRFACIDFIAQGKTKPSEFMNRLMTVYRSYAPQVSRNLMNLLSSHDTSRFLTDCNGDADLHRLAATVQFTWVGTPSIYYGEEIGMEGGADPDNRRGMRWDLATDTNPMLRFYKRLIALRKASPALQSGDPRVLLTDDAAGTLAYARELGNDAAVVALNRSGESRQVSLALPTSLRQSGVIEALTGRRLTLGAGQTSLLLTLAPHSSAVLLPARGEALRLASVKESREVSPH